jgi:NAD(P)-dependent dehydrogenase (short-subunit alcohol dehydrogenase family)
MTSALLTDKIVLITGASGGIGAATARLAAREGATVVLASRRMDELETIARSIRSEGGAAQALPLDLADDDSIRAAVDRVLAEHGRLDGAVNNGAAIQHVGPVDATSREDLDLMYRVNFLGQWVAMVAQAEAMRVNGTGSIVNVSSIGSRRSNPQLPAYGAMKRAVNSATETAAVNWAAAGIRVNAVAPGGTATDMMTAWASESEGIDERLARANPMGRLARAEEVAEAIVWLLSDRSSFVTGILLPVDGGAGA